MPSDANIFQSYLQQPKSVIDYANEYDQAAARKNALAQSVQALQKGQMDLNNAADVNRQRNALRDAVTSGQIDLSNPDHAPRALAIAPDVAPAMLKTVQEGVASRALAAKDTAQAGHFGAQTDAEKFNTRVAKSDQAIKDISALKTPQDALASLEQHVANGDIDPVKAAEIRAGIPQDPSQFPKWQLGMVRNIMTAKEQMEYMAPTANTVATNQTSLATNAATNATHIQGINIQQAGENARQGKTLAKDYAVAGMNPDGTPRQMPVAQDGSLDLTKIPPEDLAAAQRYKTDGTLPPNMGRGAQGAAESKRIRAIATALDAQAGESPEDARIRQLATKGDIGAIAAMRKREVQIAANVKNFDFNADQVEQLSQKVDRTGVPLVNAWINAGRRSVTGNPDLSAFDVAVKTTVNEFAQIVGGTTAGATTEGEKKKAEALLNAQQTPEQILSVINQMRIESKNRMESFASTRRGMMPTNGGKPAPAATPASSPGMPSTSAIDAELARRAGKK